jgi:hypothetical protein
MSNSGVNDFVLSLLPKLGTMGSNEGEVRVTGLSTLFIFWFSPHEAFEAHGLSNPHQVKIFLL